MVLAHLSRSNPSREHYRQAGGSVVCCPENKIMIGFIVHVKDCFIKIIMKEFAGAHCWAKSV